MGGGENAGASTPDRMSRRRFLARTGTAAAAGLVMSPTATLVQSAPALAAPANSPGTARREAAYQVRVTAAANQRKLPLPKLKTNGDEARYPDGTASFSKSLPHDDAGMVDPAAYGALLAALASGKSADFEAIPLGGTAKLANPLAAYAFTLEGADSHHLDLAAPPAFASRLIAGELTELYWHALARDVAFADYGSSEVTDAAAQELRRFPYFSGVTASTLFRGETPGDLVGPYVSQFLYKQVPYGPTPIDQKSRWPVAGVDFMTTMEDCLAIQRGQEPTAGLTLEATPRYIQNARDLGEWVHRDYPYQGGLNAGLILLGFGRAALSPTNPYLPSATMGNFVSFGAAHITDAVARITTLGLKAAWFHKWLVHRRLRPEMFAARLHQHVLGARSFPIHPTALNSTALARIYSAHGSYVLPMAYPEGCPTHPAYPAGHAVLAGAFATVLKAFFNEAFEIPNPVVPSADGLSLVPYDGALTVGGELNKLAANVAIGRDLAGVHWRSDGIEGLRLGEAVAVSLLRDLKLTLSETSPVFQFTGFSGATITV